MQRYKKLSYPSDNDDDLGVPLAFASGRAIRSYLPPWAAAYPLLSLTQASSKLPFTQFIELVCKQRYKIQPSYARNHNRGVRMGKIADKDMPNDEKRQPRKVAPNKQTRYPLVAAKGKSQNRHEQQLQQGSEDEIFGVSYHKSCVIGTLYMQPIGYSIVTFDIPPEETYTLFYLM